jgi:alpha,alpha-trehalose phosphorylase (configuration-retaining)
MRHALIRLCRLMGIDVHWFVAKPKPEVFEITKRKFHNVLQVNQNSY